MSSFTGTGREVGAELELLMTDEIRLCPTDAPSEARFIAPAEEYDNTAAAASATVPPVDPFLPIFCKQIMRFKVLIKKLKSLTKNFIQSRGKVTFHLPTILKARTVLCFTSLLLKGVLSSSEELSLLKWRFLKWIPSASFSGREMLSSLSDVLTSRSNVCLFDWALEGLPPRGS